MLHTNKPFIKISLMLSAWVLIFFTGCKKDQSKPIAKTAEIPVATGSIRVYKDTTTAGNAVKKKSVNGGNMDFTINYFGSGKYSIICEFHASGGSVEYDLVKDGVIFTALGTQSGGVNFITDSLPPGTYYMQAYVYGSGYDGPHAGPTFSIITQPTAPTGMVCCYRYYNPTSGQHLCTSDWQELACISHLFVYEKVVGYMYPSSSSAPNLKPVYRYYNASDGDHLITGIVGPYNGFVFESIIGYVGISQTTDLTKAMNKYYSNALTDHFICAPPEVPLAQGYSLDGTIGYMQ